MKLDKEKINKAIDAVNEACLHCGSAHANSCPISVARQELMKVA